MPQTLARIAVIHEGRRIDVALPAAVAIAELLPELVRLAGAEHDDGVLRWSLARIGDLPLAGDATLAGSGVVDGQLLVLERVDQLSDAAAVVDDLPDAIAHAVADRTGAVTVEGARRLAGIAGAVVAVAGAVALVDPGPSARVRLAAAAVGAVVLVGLAVLATRRWRRPAIGAGAALAAVAYLAVAAVAATELRDPVPSVAARLAWAAGAAAVGGLLVVLVAPVVAAVGVALAIVAAVVGAAAGIQAVSNAGVAHVAAVTAVVGAALVLGAPALAYRLAAVRRLDLGDVTHEQVRRRVSAGRRSLAWLHVAAAVIAVVSAAVIVLVSGAGAWGPLLAVAVAVTFAFRLRIFRVVGEVLPLLAVPVLTGVALVAGAVRLGWTVAAADGALLAALVAFGVLLGGVPRLSAVARRRLGQLELFVQASVVPLCLGAAGVFDAVVDLAHRAG